MRAALVTALILVWALTVAAPEAAAGGPNVLRRPSVDPMVGTTASVFTFTVRYRSFANDPATGVSASVPGLTIPLSLASGSAVNGTWSASSTLPAGSWTVTYTADAQQFNDPVTAAGPVQVVPTPTPTPSPTPSVTPAPTPTPAPPPQNPPPPPPPPPAPAPVVPAPAATPAPTAAPTAPGATPAVGTEGSPSQQPAIASPVDGDPPPLGLLLGAGAVAILGLVGWWWLLGRDEDDDASTSPVPPVPPAPPEPIAAARSVDSTRPATRRARPPADWELASALDDAPIGTVDFEGGTDDLPPDLEAALAAPVIHTGPGNARTRRMAEMHSWRDETDRRSLLRRVGLPEVDED